MQIPIGIDKDSRKIRTITEVPRGLDCNCICPACSARLIAKKGNLKAPHFAHYRSTENQDCRETAIHLMAKYILTSRDSVLLKPIEIASVRKYSNLQEPFQEFVQHFTAPINVYDVQEEVSLPEFAIKPDILCKFSEGGTEFELAIEIAVTHKSDEIKHEKIRKADLTTVEIDLHDLTLMDRISFADIEREIENPKRIEWLHVSSQLNGRLTDKVNLENERKVQLRNEDIESWHKSLLSNFRESSRINVPTYKFSENQTSNEYFDISNKYHKFNFKPPPQIGGNFLFFNLRPPQNAVMMLDLIWNNKVIYLPILVSIGDVNPEKLEGSHLVLKSNSLPPTNEVENLLQWGKSILAEKYIDEITKIRRCLLLERNNHIEKLIQHKYSELESVRSATRKPLAKNINNIELDYRRAKISLTEKGFSISDITTEIADGWIFGCPENYWQILLFQSLCIVDNKTVSVSFYNSCLEKYHQLQAIEPVKSLNFLNPTIQSLGYEYDVPSSYGVIQNFFTHLVRKAYLKHSYRGTFEKAFSFGKVYKRL